MFSRVFQRGRSRAAIPEALYGAIVAQAREPVFYIEFGVPDTVEGRLEMIVIHTVLLLRHLRGDPDQALIGQGVFDTFCVETDRALREMGVGDLSVPKKMRRVGEAFYGRAVAYDSALDAGDEEALSAVVDRNVLSGKGPTMAARQLAAYIMAADVCLKGQAVTDGRVSFPEAASFTPARKAQ